jgi:hypothetical protein
VVFIETMRGSRGAEIWVLTLACGHQACRTVPPIRPDMFLTKLLRTVKAPERVRCLHCGLGDPPNPERLREKADQLLEGMLSSDNHNDR